MDKPLISVIIPIYKVEPYLHRCVDSVLSQTYDNIEVILVDDGSPDGCPKICDDYKNKDMRIKVIHKSNGGLSDARNAGIELAQGEWLSFIDSDDWIESDMYEALIKNALDNDAQISVGGVSDDKEMADTVNVTKTTFDGIEKIEVLSPEKMMEKYFCGVWAAWDKIYRRKIFEDIRYPVGEINEDEAIVLKVLDKCDRIVCTNKVFYHYMWRENSITTAVFSEKKMAWYYHCKSNLEWIRLHYPKLENVACTRLLSSILWLLNQIVTSDDVYSDARTVLTEYVKNEYKILYKNAENKKQKLELFLIRFFPFSVYSIIIRLKRG